jgi:mono/diheme cytochrome c family protein
MMKGWLCAVALAVPLAAGAADDRFHKKTPDSMMGFLAVRDALYRKECGTCHFAYSPGLMPARSWVLQLDRMAKAKHFGESVELAPDTRAKILDYLTRNAADVSPYEGSKTFMERIPASQTPYRFSGVPLFREMHTVIHEVINTKNKVKVRSVTNCNACHRKADDGSFGNDELYIPGLTGP